MATSIKSSLLIVIACALLGLVANFLNPQGIPFIAKRAYTTLVPCPEPGGDVSGISVDEIKLEKRSFIIDARSVEAYRLAHLKNAVHLTYDYLDPTPKEKLKEIAKKAAQSRANRVVVYGDGQNPDSGKELAKEISASGLKNVCYIIGGEKSLDEILKRRGNNER